MMLFSKSSKLAVRVGFAMVWLGSVISDDFGATPEGVETMNQWYHKYPQYPDYCSTPSDMDTRKIPVLETHYDTKLVHVTSILKHGARTPFGRSPDNQCWDGYWESNETAVWNCAITEFLAPPDPQRILEEEQEGGAFAQKSMFLFEKDYDALRGGDTNVLNGTCQEGQLIIQGYEQMVTSGKMLREAYVYIEGEFDHDERMRLFDVNPESEIQPWDGRKLYLRANDDQPTLMSGQLLLRGLLADELEEYRMDTGGDDREFPTIPVHTADRDRDILGGFQEQCDLLNSIQEDAETSQDYDDFYNSEESQQVRDFMEKQLVHDQGLFDCLMTTVCTDRPLPERFGIYNPHPNSWFNRISAYHAKNHSFHLRYNDAEYSKLSMGPLWAEIFDHISPVLNRDDDDDRVRPPAKLAVYSGYDTTIMQILSSLGPNMWDGDEWPPYASMFLIEIHEFMDKNGVDTSTFTTDFAFRLIYNGEVLTNKVEGCEDVLELCDAAFLVKRVEQFANRLVECDLPEVEEDKKVHAMKVLKTLLATTGGILLVLAVVALSALVGAFGVYVHLTGSIPSNNKLTRKDPEDYSSTGKRTSSMVSDNVEMSMADASPFDDDDK